MSEKSFGERTWERIKKALVWLRTKLLGPIGALLVIVVAILLVSMGYKELQIGGILGKLLGRKNPDNPTPIDLSNSIDKDRVGSTGELIQPGNPDEKGQTQVVVVPIQEPGLFSNPDTVKFTPPGEKKPVEVQLPTGVKNKDVEQVVIVKPSTPVVVVKDTSKITAQRIDDLLKKYGN